MVFIFVKRMYHSCQNSDKDFKKTKLHIPRCSTSVNRPMKKITFIYKKKNRNGERW